MCTLHFDNNIVFEDNMSYQNEIPIHFPNINRKVLEKFSLNEIQNNLLIYENEFPVEEIQNVNPIELE